ncbi:Type I restriction-modification system, specificity subunit S [Methanosarcina mazei C16]|uniref:Type I restriction-modification system, specificity subunit S n=1 Tax=Methanosarcina mazei C16 TaxID=1434113 RepID=A0A0E3RX99_METMZ|nr:Type I restriction-modification system, specificity subunit S [Methanosarcina mazei C16]
MPEGWKSVSLGELVQPSKEKIEPSENPNLKYVGLEHIESHKCQIKGYGFSVDIKSTKTMFHRGDVLYGKLRPYLNKVCVPNFDGVCSTDILVFNATSNLNNYYLMRFLSTPNVVDYASNNSSGVQLPRINFQKLSSYTVPLPPLSEQHRIVSAIEALFARLDATNEKLDRVQEILKKFRESVLAAACEGRLTEVWREENQGIEFKVDILDSIDLGSSVDSEVIIDEFNLPDTWKWTTVDSIGHVKGGKRLQKGSNLVNYDTSYPYLRAGNLKNGTVEGEILYLQQNDYNQISKYTISSSDVYITIVGACIGDSGIVPEEYDGANLTENAAKVCDLHGVFNQYLALVFRSKIIQDQIQNQTAGGHPTLKDGVCFGPPARLLGDR